MSPLTIFLGKLIGIYCIIAALALMAQKQRAVEAVNGLIRSPALPGPPSLGRSDRSHSGPRHDHRTQRLVRRGAPCRHHAARLAHRDSRRRVVGAAARHDPQTFRDRALRRAISHLHGRNADPRNLSYGRGVRCVARHQAFSDESRIVPHRSQCPTCLPPAETRSDALLGSRCNALRRGRPLTSSFGMPPMMQSAGEGAETARGLLAGLT
jgi:hypothetical protein